MYTSTPGEWTVLSWRVRIISRPVRSPTWARRGYWWPPKLRCRVRPSGVRSTRAPQASSSLTRARAPPHRMACARGAAARAAVEGPAHQVAGRVAGEAIERERSGVDQQHERADPDADAAPEARPLEHVAPEEGEVDERDVERIAVQGLEDEGQGGLAAVAMPARLAHCARRRIEEVRAVVGLAVVVAGGAEEDRRKKDQERRRVGEARDDDERRVERREVAAAAGVGDVVVAALDGGPVGVADEGGEEQALHERRDPPRIPPLRGGETRRPNRVRRDSHGAPLCETARSIGEARGRRKFAGLISTERRGPCGRS